MSKRTLKAVRILALAVLVLNLSILGSQLRLGTFKGGTELVRAKSFANQLISDLQGLAADLGVAEKSSVKQALAKLHYDVYLVDELAELAKIVQNSASKTRELIVSESARANAERVLTVLNTAREVQYASAQTILTIEPLLAGGYKITPHDYLQEATLARLEDVENLFGRDSLSQLDEPLRRLTIFKVLIDNGVAQLISQSQEQDTIKYLEGEIETLRSEYARVNKLAGFAEIAGPGVVISVYDQIFSVSAGDLRRIIGELYSAGATAIAINGHRLAVNSFIVDSDDSILVDGYRVRNNPVVIEAIGETTTLVAGVDLLFSVSLKGMLGFDIDVKEQIVLPAKVQ